MQSLKKTGSLLDIGASYGAFAYLAIKAGFAVDAIEREPACCRFLTQSVGVRSVGSDSVVTALQDLPAYDVITLWHVAEHLPDFWDVLEVMSTRLLPGGLLLIATPNPMSLQFRLFRHLWAHLDAPRHPLLIPPSTLVVRAESLGLRNILLTTTDTEAYSWNTFGWQHSIANVAGHRGRTTTQCLGRLVSLVLRPLERSGRRGASYTAAFEKRGAR